MKSKISLIFLLFFVISGLKAQDVNINNFRLGFQASPLFSWMTSNDNTINNNGSNLGFRLAFVSEYYFSETYAFAFGLNYSLNQGGRLLHEEGGNLLARSDLSNALLAEMDEEGNFPDGTDIHYKIQYIEIPISVKMRTREFGYIRYFAQLPEFTLGFPVKSRGTISNDAASFSHEKELIGKDVNFFNISWGLGGGMEYSVSETTSLTAGIHFQQSFIDVTRNKGFKTSGEEEDSKGNIGIIQLRVGVLF